MFEKWKAKRAEAKRVKAEALQLRVAQQKRAKDDKLGKEINEELEYAQARLEAVKEFHGATGAEIPSEVNIVLKSRESVYLFVSDAVLIETRKGAGKWNGRSQGVSMPIPGTKLRYRVGASKGSFEQGEEKPTPIDTGTFVVTSTRAVFTGQKQSREWEFTKLLSIAHYDPGWTAIAVSNRQKISGVGVDSANRELFEFWIDLAVARASGDTSRIEADCQDDVDQLKGKLLQLPPGSRQVHP